MLGVNEITGIWIIDANSGITLINRLYMDFEDQSLITNFFSSITAFAKTTFYEDYIDSIFIKEKEIVYIIANSIIFIALSQKNFGANLVRKILNRIQMQFFRTFPNAASKNWEFHGQIDSFLIFEPVIDNFLKTYQYFEDTQKLDYNKYTNPFS